MQTIIGVRFKKAGKIYYFGPGDLTIKNGDRVVVETVRGTECGLTVIGPREIDDSQLSSPIKTVQRIADEADLQRLVDNKASEAEAFGICENKIQEHNLPMKLIEVEYTFDRNKIIFYFTADGRIDFRELVKDLAAVFRTRIELRQIGVRDEAKLMGGIGCCGRPLCCASFLGDFEPVSIRMAKEQNLSLNPTKISGICGRLMCCLKYENDCYCEGCHGDCHTQPKKVLPPKQGSRVVSIEGEGKVISINQQRRTATILLDNSRTIVASWEDVIEKDEADEVIAGSGSDYLTYDTEKESTNQVVKTGSFSKHNNKSDRDESSDKNGHEENRKRPRLKHLRSNEKREGHDNRRLRDRRPRNKEKNNENRKPKN